MRIKTILFLFLLWFYFKYNLKPNFLKFMFHELIKLRLRIAHKKRQ